MKKMDEKFQWNNQVSCQARELLDKVSVDTLMIRFVAIVRHECKDSLLLSEH